MPPLSILHVCIGNICRSPMAQCLLRARAAELVADDRVDGLIFSHSAGTGGWHVGQPMNPPAARQLRVRGVDPSGFAARRLTGPHLDASDLILAATGGVAEYVGSLRPDAAARTFVLGELARLLADLDVSELPPASATPEAVHHRGVALVSLLDRQRKGRSLRREDDLDDPYGMADRHFARVADQIDDAVRSLAAVLFGA